MSALRTKKRIKILAGAALALSLVVAPLVANGAAAAEPALVGQVGVWEASTNENNSVKYWEDRYKDHQADCYKVDGPHSSSHGTISADKKTITLKAFDQSWPGDHWEALIIKAGNTNNVIRHPEAGVAYASPLTSNGKNQADVSHWIVCKGTTPEEEPEPEVVVPSLTFTPPTCLADGVVTRSSGVNWTFKANDDGTTTWTATPVEGTTFPEGAQTSWTVPNLGKLPLGHESCRPTQPPAEVTEVETFEYDCESASVTITTTTTTTPYVWNGEAWVPGESTETVETDDRAMTADEKMDCPLPNTKIEYGSWQDGEWECSDTEVTQTREVTTTVYEYDEQGNPTAKSSVATETQTRLLTQEELAECPLLPGDIESVCVGDVPYLGYEVILPEGYEADSETPVTITFLNPDGDDYVVTDQALSGTLLWPGASATEPKMWPGWELVDGEYVQTDGNYAWTREGITIRFEVNPSYSTEVEYPQATALCANPPIGGGEPSENPVTPAPSGTPAPALAVTGGGVSPLVPAAGGIALLLGIAALAVVAARRRQSAS